MSPSPEAAREVRDGAHLVGAEAARRQHEPDPVQPGLFLRMDTEMGLAVVGGAGSDEVGGAALQRTAELRLDRGQEFIEAPGIEHIFQAGHGCGRYGPRSR